MQKLLLVLECLKDHAFDSADCLRSPSLCLLQGQLWNVDKGFRARINYMKLSCFLHYPLMV